MMLLWMACTPQRVDQLTVDVDRSEVRAQALRDELTTLKGAVTRAESVWAHRPPIHMPDGFDATKPLPAGSSRPDVLLLSIDTLRADHLGTYGYSRDTSPFIDSLAARGTRYEQFWAPSPWTLPSHATMLSGQLPYQHGVVDDRRAIGASLPLLQETLSQDGYATAGVVSTLFVSDKFGFARGFDFFEDFGITSPKANNQGVVDAEEIFATALHWAQRQDEGQPLFLFLHSYDVHYTYNAPQPFDERFDRPARIGDAIYKNYRHYKRAGIDSAQLAHQIAQYDEEISYVDDQLRQFVEHWERSGRELIIAVTSDHGEEFGERGSWGHAHTLYPEQLRVPLVVAGPGIRHQQIAERAGTEDLATTLATLAGASHPNGHGIDRAQQLTRGGRAGSSGEYADTSRFDTLRLRVHHGGLDLYVDLRKRQTELYDTRLDPDCKRDLSPSRPADVDRLMANLTERLANPWGVTEAGEIVAIEGGVLWTDGPQGSTLDARVGDRFTLLPPDAGVRLMQGSTLVAGPFSPSRGTLPSPGEGLIYGGPVWGTPGVELTSKDEQMLRELGYIQD